ncbi:MAG: hypothetical protein U5L08_05915 [Xanthomonadales bacterium]|nr:hypothetical protein [Xanthomonadales bacterium]
MATSFGDVEIGRSRQRDDVDRRLQFDPGDLWSVVPDRDLEAVAGRFLEQAAQAVELGHVAERFARQSKRVPLGRKALSAVAVDRSLYAALAAVVGGQREIPVAELVVQVLEVVKRAPGGGPYVSPAVVEIVDLDATLARRRTKELPGAGGPSV